MAKNVEFVEEFVTKPTFDDDGVQVSSGIGVDGREYPDPVPMAPPIGYNEPPDLMSMIKRMVHHELFSRAVDEAGYETFDESDDFGIEDDPGDPLTDYERVFEPAKPAPGPQAPAGPASPPVAPQPVASAVAEGGGVGAQPKTPPADPPGAVAPSKSAQSST